MLGDKDVDAIFVALAVEGTDSSDRVNGIDQPLHPLLAIKFVRLQLLLPHIFFLFCISLDVNSEELFILLIVFNLAIDDCLVACVLLSGGDTIVIIKDEENIALEVDTHSVVMQRRSVFLL